jgi:RimJ/RimL family protein N-acetyltransferase
VDAGSPAARSSSSRGWHFDVFGLERLELCPHRQNADSRAVARRAGFTPDATPVIARPECDTVPDMLLYALRSEDWARVHPTPS